MTSSINPRAVVVIIGCGGMGLAVARRVGAGRTIVLADYSEKTLGTTSELLRLEGHHVETVTVDVANYDSVRALAATSSEHGQLFAVVHTAGLSPMMATADRILAVDLLGTANVIEAFKSVAIVGMSVVCIASMAGYTVQLPKDVEKFLATSPLEGLLAHPALSSSDPGTAYALSKRANQLRVQGSARAYGVKGARLNSLSPGVITTAMGKEEMNGPMGAYMKSMVASSASGRFGTPQDIAGAVAFLVGGESSFIQGIDLLVDGGVTGPMQWAE